MTGSMNLHDVTGINLVRVNYGGFICHEFTLHTKDGGAFYVSAFAAGPLTISESERNSGDYDDGQAVLL